MLPHDAHDTIHDTILPCNTPLTMHPLSTSNDTLHDSSGAADNTVRLWNKTTAEMIRVVHGHSKSVLSMEIGEEWLCTAGGDEEIRVWTIGAHGKHSIAITCIHRLVGRDRPQLCSLTLLSPCYLPISNYDPNSQ